MKNKHKRDLQAIAAHFRNSAGMMKDRKKDKKIFRKQSRKIEQNKEE
jgi:RIO-like serine/threonine protein kinase